MPAPDPNRLDDLKRRWAQDPGSRLYLQLADEHRKHGQLEEAESVLVKGLEHRPSDLSGLVALGRCRLELGELAEAVASLETVIARDPSHMVAGKLLVEAHLQQGDAAKAGERLETYRLFNDRDPELAHFDSRLQQLSSGSSPSGEPAAEEPVAEAEAVPPEVAEPGPVVSEPVVSEPVVSEPVVFEQGDRAATEPTAVEPAVEPAPAAPRAEPVAGVTIPLAAPSNGDEIFHLGAVPAPPSLEVLWQEPSPARRPAEPFSGLIASSAAALTRGDIFRIEPPPAVAEPMLEKPLAEEALAEEPVIEEPSIEEPIVEEPVVEEPVVEEQAAVPRVEEPAMDPLLDTRRAELPAPAMAEARSDEPAIEAEPLPAPQALISQRPAVDEEAPTERFEIAGPPPLAEPPEPVAPVVEEPEAPPAVDEDAPTERLEVEALPFAGAPAAERVEEAAMGIADETPTEKIGIRPAAAEAPPETEPVAPAVAAAEAEAEEGEAATVTLGGLYLQQGHLEEAAKVFEQVLEQDPTNHAARAGLNLARPPQAAPLTALDLLADDSLSGTIPMGLTAKKLQVLTNYLKHIRSARERDHVH